MFFGDETVCLESLTDYSKQDSKFANLVAFYSKKFHTSSAPPPVSQKLVTPASSAFPVSYLPPVCTSLLPSTEEILLPSTPEAPLPIALSGPQSAAQLTPVPGSQSEARPTPDLQLIIPANAQP